jgi:hypothetical protein
MKAKKAYRYIVCLAVITTLFGCSASNNFNAPTPSSTNYKHINTAAPDVASPSPFITTPSIVEAIPICQEGGKHNLASTKSGISGTIVYQNDDSTGLYTIGGTPITSSQLLANKTQQNVVFGFSPDGRWLAYSPFDTSSDVKFEQLEMILLSAGGEKIKHVLSTKEFEDELQVGHQLVGVSGYSYWVNEHMIYTTLYSQSSDPNTSGHLSDLPKVLRPFDGKWNHQFLDLPERFLSEVVGISPDNSRALYKKKGFLYGTIIVRFEFGTMNLL